MNKLSRRTMLVGIGGAIGYAVGNKLRPDLPVFSGTAGIADTPSATLLNDASGLSATPIHKHQIIKADYHNGLIDKVRTSLKEAKESNVALNVGAARHSMGGQAIPRNGIAVDLDNGLVELDSKAGFYRVNAGARWSQVIASLDAQDWSPKVMQANHDFGVAATYSVNAHGWPVPFGPMGSTVKAIRMVLPSGDLVECSREHNPELFGLAMGGYGLVGVITDLDVEMVKNIRLQPAFQEMTAESFSVAFNDAVNDPAIRMAYGRMNVDRGDFFSSAMLVSFRKTDNQSDIPAASGEGAIGHISNKIYRAQLGNEAMKALRWLSETVLAPHLSGGEITRNSLMNKPVATLANRHPTRTDILHEYFIAGDRFSEFLQVCREEIPASYQELLNVTLRYVGTDNESVLSYAPTPRIAAVMSFSQEMTRRAETDMRELTQRLIERILDIGGTYYLPYRPHASVEQFARAYPKCEEFSSLKRDNDPNLLLRNNFWDSYLEKV